MSNTREGTQLGLITEPEDLGAAAIAIATATVAAAEATASNTENKHFTPQQQ